MDLSKIKRIWIITGAVILLVVGAYILIFHSHHFQQEGLSFFGKFFFGIGIMTLCLSLAGKWFPLHLHKKIRLLSGFVAFGILILAFYSVDKIKDKYYSSQLEKYGQHAIARVVYTYTHTSKGRIFFHSIILYSYNGKEYRHELYTGREEIYSIEDSMDIIISSRDPEIIKWYFNNKTTK